MLNLSQIELGWIAGFFEGEASFLNTNERLSVQVAQVQLEPLTRLMKLLGGSLYHCKRHKAHQNDYFRWHIRGDHAEELMRIIYSLMSPKRQKQIERVLAWYKTRPGSHFEKNPRKTCLSKRHAWIPENIEPAGNGRKRCKLCQREYFRNYIKSKRSFLAESINQN